MGKKKNTGYNEFLDGEKLRDNTEIRTTLNDVPSTQPDISPPSTRTQRHNNKSHHGKGGPKKPPLTHFLCLPLVTDTSRPALQQSIDNLKDHMTKTTSIPTRAIRPVGSLHLTLGVMSLTSPQTLQAAHAELQTLNLHSLLRDISDQKIAEQAAADGAVAENLNAAFLPDTDSLTIDLQALVPMHSPSSTSILYAKPWDQTGRLYPFASAVRDRFVQSGFVVDEGRKLKLHATIVNTVYAKPKGGQGRRGRKSGVRETLKHLEQKVSPHHHSHGDKAQSGDDEAVLGDGVDGAGGEEKARSEGHGPDAKSWMKFDVTQLIEGYKDFVWAKDVRIDKVQICKMGAMKVWSGGVEGEGEVVDEQYEVVFEKEIYE